MLLISPWSLLAFLTSAILFGSQAIAELHRLTFVIKETPITRQCQRRNIITVNGQFNGTTLYVHRGDTLIVKTYNTAPHNATIHWHGVRQIRSGWADGPGYITQCPIQQGGNYTYRFTIVAKEGTLWWHAHVSWLRATVC
ncbi:hypothetical protein SUGI_1108480 [Cryptomeria japonica]|nr:hypothetical protein SUGI_1108480 [Cryptomeria japonica]